LNELPLLNELTDQKPRQIAAQILQRRSGGRDFVEDLLETALARTHLSTPDRGLCQELVYGVVRWQAALDWLIARKTQGRTQKPMLQTLLRLGLYQIFWLDRIPNHAAVHETVEEAKQSGFGPQSGFVNAVLRGYLREFDATKAALVELKTTQPHIGCSHPEWLVTRWQKRWGAEKAAQLMDWNNAPPKTFARINDLKFGPAQDQPEAGRARHSVRGAQGTSDSHHQAHASSPNAGTTSPSPPRSGGLELLGKQRKESAEGGGPKGAERAGASEPLGRGEVAFRAHGDIKIPKDPGDLLTLWRNENVDYDFVRRDWLEENLVFELKSHSPLAKLASFQQGLFYIQDPSTLLAVRELNPQPGETILDLCAAPGGKLTYIAQRMRNTGKIIAHDTFPERLKLIEENCARLGVTIAQAVLLSTLEPVARRSEAKAARPSVFDRVLVDAPCSNSGVMRRRVDLRWRIRPEEIDRLRTTQLELLCQAAALLKPGGTLVYSTCSLEPEENESVIREFLARELWFRLENQRDLIPFADGTDGAYVARLTKKN
jgi:16S rRNA C967 or C1407 C5-methylase (RsmB/RsmF family)